MVCSVGTTKVWFGDGLKSKTLWFEVKTDLIDMKAYSKTSQKGSFPPDLYELW